MEYLLVCYYYDVTPKFQTNQYVESFCGGKFPEKANWESRPHSFPDPSCGREISRGKAKNPFPQKKDFRFAESVLKPHALPEYLEGRTPKEKHPFLFQRKIHPRQIRNARSVFSFGVAGVLASAWGFLRAYDFGQSHHALRACLIRGSAGNESELFGIMTTILNLKKD